MITLGLVDSVDDNGVYVTMPGSRGLLRGPFQTLQNVTAGDRVLMVVTNDGEDVIVGPPSPSGFSAGLWADWDCDLAAMTALGDGTFVSRWTRTGDTVHFRIDLTVGASTTFSGGNWMFPLPVACAVAAYTPVLAYYLDSGTSDGYLTARISDAGAGIRLLSAGDYVNATVPHTWAVGDQLHISGTYEAA